MYKLLNFEIIEKTSEISKTSNTFATADLSFYLGAMNNTFPLAILYVIAGEENSIDYFEKVAQSLSNHIILVIVGSPKDYGINEIDEFLEKTTEEFCGKDFIPINEFIGQYETRETFIYGNPIGELVAAYIYDYEGQREVDE